MITRNAKFIIINTFMDAEADKEAAGTLVDLLEDGYEIVHYAVSGSRIVYLLLKSEVR